jgi:predicted phosphodiesterase
VSEIWAAEIAAVATDSVTVTFVTESGVAIDTAVGDVESRTTGPFHVVEVGGLAPDTEYAVRIDGVAADEQVPAVVRTLPAPAGPVLATIATVNDVHFGETVCGMIHTATEEELGPWVRSAPGEDPYPVTMNRAAVAEIEALGPDAVIAKGDLTCVGSEEEYQLFLATYARFGDRLHHVRGNHDAMLDPTLAVEGSPYAIELGGATLAVVDTVRPTAAGGRLTREQLGWLDETAAATTGPVLVFGHHQIWDLHAPARPDDYFGIDPDSSEAFAAIVQRRENIAGYFCGHTHRHRIRRFPEARDVPFVEVGAVKEYMGVWAEYRIHADGYTQTVHRLRAPEAMSWSERTRHLYGGIYPEYARGPLDHRCFTHSF